MWLIGRLAEPPTGSHGNNGHPREKYAMVMTSQHPVPRSQLAPPYHTYLTKFIKYYSTYTSTRPLKLDIVMLLFNNKFSICCYSFYGSYVGALTRNGRRTPARSFKDPLNPKPQNPNRYKNVLGMGALFRFLWILLKCFTVSGTHHIFISFYDLVEQSVCPKVKSALWVGQNIILERTGKGKVNLAEIGQMKNALWVGKT